MKHVPPQLARLDQWMVWKWIIKRQPDGTRKKDKMPINPRTFAPGKSNDPATWGTLRQAEAAFSTRDFAGLAFVFARGGDLFGIDLDGCISLDGELAPWAERILERFPTYAEMSPTGTGIKLYGVGRHQATGIKQYMGPDDADGRKRAAVEVYGWGRYFCFTGNQWPGSADDLADCRGPLAELVERLRPKLAPRPVVKGEAAPDVRAERYLAKVQPCQCGTASCHHRTYNVAAFLVNDLRLTVEGAYPWLAAWVARGTHPWTEEELVRKLTDAQRRGNGKAV